MNDDIGQKPVYTLKLQGSRGGRPSRRLTIKAPGLRINDAKIKYNSRNKVIEHEVVRINFLPTRQETRLHTAQLQYPGNYEIELRLDGAAADNLKGVEVNQLTSIKFSTE